MFFFFGLSNQSIGHRYQRPGSLQDSLQDMYMYMSQYSKIKIKSAIPEIQFLGRSLSMHHIIRCSHPPNASPPGINAPISKKMFRHDHAPGMIGDISGNPTSAKIWIFFSLRPGFWVFFFEKKKLVYILEGGCASPSFRGHFITRSTTNLWNNFFSLRCGGGCTSVYNQILPSFLSDLPRFEPPPASDAY